MNSSSAIPENITGLNSEEVTQQRQKFGINKADDQASSRWWHSLLDIVKEPMFLLLLAVTFIYLLVGETSEAWFMLGALVAVSGISFVQDKRNRDALEVLRKLNAPQCKVIRDGQITVINSEELVVGDSAIAEEGDTIAADGTTLYTNDFSVNEAILTGESFPADKTTRDGNNHVFSGTMVISGMAIYQVTAIGNTTKVGQLGQSLGQMKEQKGNLQVHIQTFIRNMAIAGVIVFMLIWLYQYLHSGDVLASLLKGLTLAMSILPEEIPVAFTTFMALGSWRLINKGIIVKRLNTVETLGNASVICVDKTGTITENKMSVAAVYSFRTLQTAYGPDWKSEGIKEVIATAMWASEPMPFDPMEQHIHQLYASVVGMDERASYHMIHEYPLSGIPPLMTHVYANTNGNSRIIAAKGSPEGILAQCHQLSASERAVVMAQVDQFSAKGYRVLAVATAPPDTTDLPRTQQELPLKLCGLLAFYDPPKEHIASVFHSFYNAGINIKVITGDNTLTTRTIVSEAGLRNAEQSIEGNELMQLSPEALRKKVKEVNVFTRMFPEAKLKIIEALKAEGEIVAMTGDGVNDAPALKAAHIGVAMGQKGTEVAKHAAALVLSDDDLSHMTEAIAMGRKIYTNIRKAVRYIVSIHIPIILVVSLPLFLGWKYPDIFTPVHVIFLELIMGPTCSIVYENEPMESNTMSLPPEQPGTSFLSLKELGLSIIQGLVIAICVLLMYQYALSQGSDEQHTRSIVFTTIVVANIALTLSNRSFYYSFLYSLRNRNNLLGVVLAFTVTMLLLVLYIPALAGFFKLAPLEPAKMVLCILTGTASVFWFEIWKWIKRKSR